MSTKEDARRILEIDPLQLDKEWLKQPMLFFDFAAELVEAKNVLDQAKAELELIDADIDREIRRDPEKYGVIKITENIVAAIIPSRPKHKEAYTKFIEAKYEVGIIQAAVDALDQRKKALENLVTLHGQNYFAEPRTPKGMGEEVGEMKRSAAFNRRKNHS